jgi:glyoxylase-like metal-dependent hydrolase (beta-lactamase superfamily II)
MVIELSGRPLRIADTPGHALHHNCIWDEASRGWFTGDTFGIVYPELDTPRGPYIVPATAPVQFDQKALHASVERLLAQGPELMYLTHYGAVRNAETLAVQFLAQVDAMADAARALIDAPDRHNALKRAFADIYVAELLRSGSTKSENWLRDLLAIDVELNAQGLGTWLDKSRM